MAVACKQRIDVSPEMLAFVGSGPVADDHGPADAVTLRFQLGDADHPPVCRYGEGADTDATVILSVSAAACRRLFGALPDAPAAWHLPSELRTLVLAVRDCPFPEPACHTMRLAKSIELLCATFARLDDLVPADGSGELSELDAARLVAARRLIDERWQEKLTLDSIARACGLNRAKLTRGFRTLFNSTVATTIADRRLHGAHGLLLATDLPVSSIGYRCGYRNNASFSRAFTRRFGLAPTRLRALELAA
ncbi:helix-turn-helix transcriptional regulator [Microvirga sp. SRT01]|jgi:AraC family transcriptional activator of pyochelin receptor|uniref:Helix-turn-helix transcriptional regulator n=1 Tax=Sphingomonas longa TaxID=2778730 RepID=A0ABS2D983_9SPHN|nr:MULTISPECIES: AraC family transcriptional regulator [Alphaproteobacteria]MBM6577493.1 helix-turn-helix transcriptional regulator [Sphingomonas sp. BT552]MBR7710538.1 helix-turn-helix transcriptional regulator [Microvirga sp. SRT01]